MYYSRSFNAPALLSFFSALVFFASTAHAKEAPKNGRQWLFGGFVLSPSLMVDEKAEERDIPDPSVSMGFAVRLGFQHALAESFYMRAEGQIGATYFRPHTAHSDGVYPFDETAFSWQIGLGAQYIPFGAEGGPTLGFNLNMYRASLTGGALQSVGGDLRLGWYFWQKNDFALLEFSYALPLLQGLNPPISFIDDPARVPQTWTYHQFGIAMTTSF